MIADINFQAWAMFILNPVYTVNDCDAIDNLPAIIDEQIRETKLNHGLKEEPLP